jgi:hypothetical protein
MLPMAATVEKPSIQFVYIETFDRFRREMPGTKANKSNAMSSIVRNDIQMFEEADERCNTRARPDHNQWSIERGWQSKMLTNARLNRDLSDRTDSRRSRTAPAHAHYLASEIDTIQPMGTNTMAFIGATVGSVEFHQTVDECYRSSIVQR